MRPVPIYKRLSQEMAGEEWSYRKAATLISLIAAQFHCYHFVLVDELTAGKVYRSTTDFPLNISFKAHMTMDRTTRHFGTWGPIRTINIEATYPVGNWWCNAVAIFAAEAPVIHIIL